MAVHKGSEGTIKVGTNAVAELLSYSITENIDLIETTDIADTARVYTTGKTSWSGEVSANWDETDSTGQGALTIGASVTLNVYPEGAIAGDTFYSGTAIVTSIDKGGDGEGLVTNTIGVTGSGALTASTV
jgi:hypothetical protein